jgi:hypothetical protein
MKIAIKLNTAQTERLKAIAEDLGMDGEELAQGAVADLGCAKADDFGSAAARVPGKNRELCRRLVI